MTANPIRAILFGASGMVGAAVLEECLTSDDVAAILVVGRSPCGREHPKLTELLHADMFDLSPVKERLTGWDACFFTLGVSSAGMKEADYTRMTYDLTLAVANILAPLNPNMTFCYVSGMGTDETGKGSSMWARVKGRTENALIALPFKAAVMFRLGLLRPVPGFKSKTRLYRAGYAVAAPLMWLMAHFFPASLATSHSLGQAMIRSAQGKAPKPRLSPRDMYELSQDRETQR